MKNNFHPVYYKEKTCKNTNRLRFLIVIMLLMLNLLAYDYNKSGEQSNSINTEAGIVKKEINSIDVNVLQIYKQLRSLTVDFTDIDSLVIGKEEISIEGKSNEYDSYIRIIKRLEDDDNILIKSISVPVLNENKYRFGFKLQYKEGLKSYE